MSDQNIPQTDLSVKLRLKDPSQNNWYKTHGEIDTGQTFNLALPRKLAAKLGSLPKVGEIDQQSGRGDGGGAAVVQCDVQIGGLEFKNLITVIDDSDSPPRIGLGLLRFFLFGILDNDIILKPLNHSPNTNHSDPVKENFHKIKIGIRGSEHSRDDFWFIDAVIDTGLNFASVAIPKSLSDKLGLRQTGEVGDVAVAGGGPTGFPTSKVDITIGGQSLQNQTAIIQNLDKVVVGLPALTSFYTVFIRGTPILVNKKAD
jgi:predicted aspartyl protease